MKYLLKRGEGEIPKGSLDLGELAFLTDKEVLVVGDGKGGFVESPKIVIGPHDQNLYAELPGHPKLIPIGLKG